MSASDESPNQRAVQVRQTGRLAKWISLVTLLVLVAVGLGVWQLSFVDHSAPGASQHSFEVPIEFVKFRQIMVRKKATAAIVSHGGMELLDEQVQGLSIDANGDDRPLVNALRGRSNSELTARKQLLVRLQDPNLEADRLSLTQVADIHPGSMTVRTVANQPAGNLEQYATSLEAIPVEGGTRVTLSVEMRVRVRVPKLFTRRADARVQEAAGLALSEQQAAIEQFIQQHADSLLILPELGRGSSN